MLKSIVLALTVAATMLAPVAANAKPKEDKGCKNSGFKSKGCSTTVPEPGDFMLVSSGLASLGALHFVRRKFQNK